MSGTTTSQDVGSDKDLKKEEALVLELLKKENEQRGHEIKVL